MKLTHIRVKDFRSFSGEHDFGVASGVNYFVGPNNCGKSNLCRALELALDPEMSFEPDRDRPAGKVTVGPPPTTRITLTFQVSRSSSPEATLLNRAKAYELELRKSRRLSYDDNLTFAAGGELKVVTSFSGAGIRQTSFQARGCGAALLPTDSREHLRLEEQFRRLVRFAVLHSGQDLESLLKGKFREILALVIADHLEEELENAEIARIGYLATLQTELLEPLRQRVLDRVGWMFPEITVAELIPDLPAVRDTLSAVDIRLGDSAVTTRLTEKGTGVRGAVLISMLQYLAEQSRRALVLVVEEPEAFLHPAGQEAIKSQLEQLAKRREVSLVVTTHSPFVVSREPSALVTELAKDVDGVTRVVASAQGDEPLAARLGSLYRDAGIAHLIERAFTVPPGTKAVVITEGYTDGFYLECCCRAANQMNLLEGLHFVPADGAKKVVLQAVLTKAATEVPVIAILDHDEMGRVAADGLERLGWQYDKGLLSLKKWPERCKQNHDVEIEDLLPGSVVKRLVARLGEDVALDGKFKCGDSWHLQLSKAWKDAAVVSLETVLDSEAGGMLWLAEELQRRAGAMSTAVAKAAAHSAQASA